MQIMNFNLRRIFGNQHRIYLDHAAATPLVPEVMSVMQTLSQETFANASAIHSEGVAARQKVETARAQVAQTLGVRPAGVVFTASGTESNNTALIGHIYALHKNGRAYNDMHVISSPLEHPSITNTLSFLESLGVRVTRVEVDETGVIHPERVREAMTPETVVVTVAYVNSEVGTIAPLRKIARVIAAYKEAQGTEIVFHSDAAQAPLWLSCKLPELQVDMLSLDAAKCGGPKGVGVLVLRTAVPLVPIAHGGPQEAGVRPGTENVVGIVGAALALKLAQDGVSMRAEQVSLLRDEAIVLLTAIPGVVVNGSQTERAANNINISIPGIDSEFAVVSLDVAGIACATKSACSGASGGGSQVVRAMTGDEARARSTIRITLGPNTTKRELVRTTEVLKEHCEKMLTFHKKMVS